jgi:methyltransferase (TIGR00027 family)
MTIRRSSTILSQSCCCPRPTSSPSRTACSLPHLTLPAVSRRVGTGARNCPAYCVTIRLQPPSSPRARYTEDHLFEAIRGGAAQYVMVGAGLETFALRHQGLRDRLQVFEIDHPSTQAFKQQALSRAGITSPPNLHFVPADLEAVSVADALRGSSFTPHVRSVFSWQGVIAYLTLQAVRDTLRSIRSVAAPGSRLLFSYLDGDAFRAEKASARIRRMIESNRSIGESMSTGFDLPVLQAELWAARFDLIEDLDPEEQQRRYFNGRTDGYHATEHFHFGLCDPIGRLTAG